MILAAGLTPAWQQTLVFDSFTLGEVNRATEAHWCGSGKVLNAGLALHQMGADSMTLSPLGAPARELIDQEFRALGASCRWIPTAAPTRVCTTMLDRASGRTTELVENAQPLTAAELQAFIAAYGELVAQAEMAVLTGSLPRGTSTTFYRDLLHAKPVPAVLDVRGQELLAALAEQPRVVKPNREELGHTFGRPLATDADVQAALQQLLAAGAQAVVMTQGALPVWVATRERTEQLAPSANVTVVNPIGCGDCLAAGIAYRLAVGDNIFDATWFGMAAAAENLGSVIPARFDCERVKTRATEGKKGLQARG